MKKFSAKNLSVWVIILAAIIMASCNKKDNTANRVDEIQNDPLVKEYVVYFRRYSASLSNPYTLDERMDARKNGSLAAYNATHTTHNGKTFKEDLDIFSNQYQKIYQKYSIEKGVDKAVLKAGMAKALLIEQEAGVTKTQIKEELRLLRQKNRLKEPVTQ